MGQFCKQMSKICYWMFLTHIVKVIQVVECYEVVLITVGVHYLYHCLGELNIIQDPKDGVSGLGNGDNQTEVLNTLDLYKA